VKTLALGITLAVLGAAGVAWAGPGQLVIITNPTGATVAVDGQNLGLAPVTARNLLPGDHVVQIWFPDGKYLSRVEKVAPDSSGVASFDAAAPTPPPAVATPKPARGNLSVTTVPPGANVAVDGQVVGVSPIIAHDLAPGDHLVQVTWADGQSGSQTVAIAGDAKVELRNPLAPPAAVVTPEPTTTAPTTTAPVAATPAAGNAVTAAPGKKPVWKKWWFWTAIGGAAVVVLAVGLGVGLGTANTRPPYGTLEF
jgi:hypothetical protein